AYVDAGRARPGLHPHRPRQGPDGACSRLSPRVAQCHDPGADRSGIAVWRDRSEEHTSELQSLTNLVCRLLLEKNTHQRAIVSSSTSGDSPLGRNPSANSMPSGVSEAAETIRIGTCGLMVFISLVFFLPVGSPRNLSLFPRPTPFR